MQNNSYKKSLLILVGTIIVTGLVLSNNTFANGTDIVDEIGVEVPISCTMSGAGISSHNADIPNGAYTPDIGSTTLHAFCNDNSGFAIYAAGYTGNEIGETNSNKLVGTSASGNATIVTGTAISAGNPDVSNWAMKLTMTQDSGDTTGTNAFTIDNSFNAYHEVPNEYTKVAHKNASTDMTASTGGVKLTTTYAAYISKTQPADTYSGQVLYALVHPANADAPFVPHEIPCEPEKICYNTNAGPNETEGTMGLQTLEKARDWSSCAFTDQSTSCYDSNYQPIDIDSLPELDEYADTILLASNYSRVGYGFAGWSDTFDYNTNPNASFYGPQETISISEEVAANGLSLYAIWIKSVGSLQDSNKVTELCGSGANALTIAPTDDTANLSSVSALTDQRDNQTYAIAKLADGNCWMIENMRLENANSYNAAGTLAQGYGGQFAGLANPETPWANNITTANSLYSINGTNNTINIGTSDTSFRFPRYNNLNTPTNASSRPQNPTSNIFSNDSTTVGMYSYGNYYTWAAAIADTTAYTTNNQSATSTSICPSGWHLPKGGDKSNEANNEFWSLIVTRINGGTNPANYNSSTQPYYTDSPEGSDISNAIRAYPNNFVYSGDVYSGSVNNRGYNGYYWSSTANGNSGAYNLNFGSSGVIPGTRNIIKYSARAIRCLASGT